MKDYPWPFYCHCGNKLTYHKRQYRCYSCEYRKRKERMIKSTLKPNKDMKFEYDANGDIKFPSIHHIENFDYNGFFVNSLPGFAKFTVKKFLSWTNDPGVGKFLCSDGKTRLIPTCQLHSDYLKTLPKEPNLKGKGLLFGPSSTSRS